MPGFAPPAETRLRGAVRRPPSPGAFRRSQRGRRGQRPGRGPEAAATGAPRPPFRPPAAGPAFTCCGRNRVRGRRPRPGRPFPQRRPSSPDARTDGPADRRAPRVGDGGPAGPHPEGAGTGSAGGARATREGATARAGLWGRESAAGDRAATLARRPGDARALALVRVAARLLVPPSRRPSLLLLPRPPRCQGNPRDAGPGGEVLGGAAAAPGARPVAAWEQLTMEPQSKAAAAGAGAGADGPPRTGVGAPRAAPRASDSLDMEIRSPPCTFVSWREGG